MQSKTIFIRLEGWDYKEKQEHRLITIPKEYERAIRIKKMKQITVTSCNYTVNNRKGFKKDKTQNHKIQRKQLN